jgi:hypothetical protein
VQVCERDLKAHGAGDGRGRDNGAAQPLSGMTSRGGSSRTNLSRVGDRRHESRDSAEAVKSRNDPRCEKTKGMGSTGLSSYSPDVSLPRSRVDRHPRGRTRVPTYYSACSCFA